MKTKKAPKRASKKPSPFTALRRELAVLKVRECSERLEKETAQRLLKEREKEIARLKCGIASGEEWGRGLLASANHLDRVLCAAAGVSNLPWHARTARAAAAHMLGDRLLLRAEAGIASADAIDALKRAESATESLTKLRTAIRTWAESYFAADDPARAWVLSLLDPVESRGGIVAMSNGSGIAVAAEGKSA